MIVVSLVDIKRGRLLYSKWIGAMTRWQSMSITSTGSVEIKLVAKQIWSTIESEHLLSSSSGTQRNRVTGYSMYLFQP